MMVLPEVANFKATLHLNCSFFWAGSSKGQSSHLGPREYTLGPIGMDTTA